MCGLTKLATTHNSHTGESNKNLKKNKRSVLDVVGMLKRFSARVIGSHDAKNTCTPERLMTYLTITDKLVTAAKDSRQVCNRTHMSECSRFIVHR